jgi:thiol:disulfide interchange protein
MGLRYLRRTMNEMKRLAFRALTVLTVMVSSAQWINLSGQILDPVEWDIGLYETETPGELDLVFHASVEPCWHIYSQFLDKPDGPLPTWFEMTLPADADSIGHVQECDPLVEYDPNFMMDLKFFEEEVFWVQRIETKEGGSGHIEGYLNFMVCDASRCLPPEDIDFKIDIQDRRPADARPDYCPPLQHVCDGESEGAKSEILEPLTWNVALYETAVLDEFDLVFHASLDPCWHVYSQFMERLDGPIPTSFTFELPPSMERVGEATECDPIVDFDPNFDMDVPYFEEEVFWVQKLKGSAEKEESISGLITFMVCDSAKCIFPPDATFSLDIGQKLKSSEAPNFCPPLEYWCGDAPVEDKKSENLWGVFLLGMLLGFAALLTPCVFPMIPMTVSFFTKQSKTRSQGIRNALIYGFFIIFIYTGLGLLLTAFFGVDVLNVISTDPIFNVFLFALLLIFGASFLGAFEIQLPTSWANKTDQAADKGGIIGIFFMAATLAIVSFSCTGPLVGSALAGAATGSFAAPMAVMFGFSLALALPFMLFSAFPGWLNSLPQSGGWLNSVKVVLGLLEIGFAFKFLSNADLVLQLGLLQRELFIAIWIAVSLAIAFYLFGWIAFPHDSKTERIGVFRFSVGMVFLTFALYLLPGMWGAPVKLISGFPPPIFYSESAGMGSGEHGSANGHVEARFTDYEQGLAAAKAEGKPVLLDFTGWACVNCRKMEEQVWPDARVANMLTTDVVLVSLYVDERTDLPASEQREESYGGKAFKVRTVGNKWSYMQASKFNTNSQPFYVMLDHAGQQIGGSAGYDPDPSEFIEFLEDGLEQFTH